MTSAFNENCNLSMSEKLKVEEQASRMLKNDMVEMTLSLGKKDVCLKRKFCDKRTIEVFAMTDTLARNEDLVTKFNKRKKAG